MHLRTATPAVLALLVALLLTGGAAAQQITFHGLQETAPRNPLFLAYTVDTPDGYQGHVDVELTGTLDGVPLFHTTSVHEHDGIFPFVVTPLRAGTLVVTATVDGEATTFTAQVTGMPNEETLSGTGGFSGATAIQFDSGSHPRFLVDALQSGTSVVLASAYQSNDHSYLLVDGDSFHFDVAAFFAKAAADRSGDGGLFFAKPQFDFIVESPLDILPPFDREAALSSPPAPCGDDTGIVWDPTGATEAGIPTFQEHAAIRLAWPDHGHPDVSYAIATPQPAFPDSLSQDPTILRAILTADPFGIATLLPPATGPLDLYVQWGDTDSPTLCRLPFEVTPNDAAPADLTASIMAAEDHADLHFAAVQDGTPVPHYEFDVRVLRHAIGYDLVWAGKLHGHQGPVDLRLDGLSPGEYDVFVYASPQSADAPPVAPPAGPLTNFTVLPQGEESQPAPAPAAALVALGLVGLALTRRRST